MTTIYLQHPVHGTKVATMEMEAVADEANGWVRYDIDTPPFLRSLNALITPPSEQKPRKIKRDKHGDSI